MKTISLFFLLSIGICIQANAQTFAEWFDQKKTQIKYLGTQIAALSVYAKTLEKGYQIAQNGLSTIDAIKRGDFHLHAGHFTSLSNVNPTVKAYWKVADILLLQASLLQNASKHRRSLRNSSQLNSGEISYMGNVYASLINGCMDILTEVSLLITDESLTLEDDERIKRIDILHAEMQDRFTFEQDFSSRTSLLALSKVKEGNDLLVLKNLYSIQ